MQRLGTFLATVTFILIGQISSSPIVVPIVVPEETTSSPQTSPPTTQSTPVVPEQHYPTNNVLKVNDSNPMLGDIPIQQDDKIDIINQNHVPLRNCKEIYDYGSFNKSGLYKVQPGTGGGEFVVYCDMTLLGGGWTVLQRRVNGKLSFKRNYASYTHGFGDFTENFWLGLDKIHRLSANSDSTMKLYIGIKAVFDRSSLSDFSLYNQFLVGNEKSGYQLTISGHNSGSAGDSMSNLNGQKFSAPDRDQDTTKSSRCQSRFLGFNGGWWFKGCDYANLNGIYYENGRGHVDGTSWRSWLGDYSLTSTVIAVRPA